MSLETRIVVVNAAIIGALIFNRYVLKAPWIAIFIAGGMGLVIVNVILTIRSKRRPKKRV